MIKKAIFILSGYNIRAITAFIRVCEKNLIPYFLIAQSEDDFFLHTKYAKNVIYIRKTKDISNLLSILIEQKNKYKIEKAYMLPSTEYLNRYLLKNRCEFEQNNINIPLINSDLYYKISDKHKFYQLCKENNILVPNQYKTIKEASFPCVIKSKSYHDYHGKPFILNHINEYPKIVKSSPEKWFIEEYIPGDSYYLLYYFKKNGSYLSFSQKNLIQQPNGGSILLSVSSDIHTKEIAKQYTMLLQKTGFYGLTMIEIKHWKNSYKMIESNPRLWGPSQLFVDAGIPFFETFLEDLGFPIKTYPVPVFYPVYYYWENGFIKNKSLTYYHFSLDKFSEQFNIIKNSEIFHRPDTINGILY